MASFAHRAVRLGRDSIQAYNAAARRALECAQRVEFKYTVPAGAIMGTVTGAVLAGYEGEADVYGLARCLDGLFYGVVVGTLFPFVAFASVPLVYVATPLALASLPAFALGKGIRRLCADKSAHKRIR